MSAGKVLSFPHRMEVHACNREIVHQHDLFAKPASNRGKIVFFDVADLVEETLLRLIAANAITALVDLRPTPVFSRPRFRHRDVVHYLHHRDIRYVEYAFAVTWPAKDRALAAMRSSDAYGWIEPALERGLALCIHDAKARELGWLDDMRRMLRHCDGYVAEVHPRSMMGL